MWESLAVAPMVEAAEEAKAPEAAAAGRLVAPWGAAPVAEAEAVVDARVGAGLGGERAAVAAAAMAAATAQVSGEMAAEEATAKDSVQE